MRQIKAAVMFVACIAIIVLSIFLKIGANDFMKSSQREGTGRWSLFFVGIIVVGIGLYYIAWLLTFHVARSLARQGKRGFVPLADKVLIHNRRKPILMLRSFTDDERFMLSPTSPSFLTLRDDRRIKDIASLDEVLTTYLNDYGAVVAIGRPGEWAPPLGAHRKYVSKDWQSEVLNLANDSQLVVMILGETEGIVWEIQQLFRMQCLQKLILVIPPASGDQLQLRWNVFRTVVCENSSMIVPLTLPPSAVYATFPLGGHV